MISDNRTFSLNLQRAALLGLKEAEHLTEYQYRLAEDALLSQFGFPALFPGKEQT